ncbi:hypothetical protein GWI33_021517 [Rhynchophorus ferrugineus]|uniref:Uncharacterized protein n=1 Tax=Rhynchophorus ferrugineus TaxID=354439 RepID=A0A834HPH4_RHYFE|nr:hypothetical protein GWI33_021518 [Rhynchophorus ferrugineus]KAF7265098.1 hypothetical protein GWI33_021517 [Rhynchophorus ferrugineus]
MSEAYYINVGLSEGEPKYYQWFKNKIKSDIQVRRARVPSSIMSTLLLLLGFLALAKGSEYMLIDKLTMDFLDLENHMWKQILGGTSQVNYLGEEVELIRTMIEFDSKLKQIPNNIMEYLLPIRHIDSVLKLYPKLIYIDRLYQKFRKFLNSRKQLIWPDEHSVTSFIHNQEMMQDIHIHIYRGANFTTNNEQYLIGNLVEEILQIELLKYNGSEYRKVYKREYFQSPQLMLYNVYNIIALRNLKTYIMMEYAYLIKQIESKTGNYFNLAIENRKKFEAQHKKMLNIVRKRMASSSPQSWRNDPDKHLKGKTYDEFTRLLQGHVENIENMDKLEKCSKNCSDYRKTSHYRCQQQQQGEYCKLPECAGNIIQCHFVESEMDICSETTQNRRYEFIRYSSGKFFGKATSCQKKRIKEWTKWHRSDNSLDDWIAQTCSYCMCLCDDPNILSDRFINLRPVLSDVKANKIITGIKFVKAQRVLHMQIQEGQLLPGGHVNQSTLDWVSLDSYNITDMGLYNDKDFYQLSYEYRSMALDNIKAPAPNYVVTGVQFVVENDMVRLCVIFNRIDWISGHVLKNPIPVKSTHHGKYL